MPARRYTKIQLKARRASRIALPCRRWSRRSRADTGRGDRQRGEPRHRLPARRGVAADPRAGCRAARRPGQRRRWRACSGGDVMLLLYLVSTLYPRPPAGRAKHWFNRLDHAAIYGLHRRQLHALAARRAARAVGWSLLACCGAPRRSAWRPNCSTGCAIRCGRPVSTSRWAGSRWSRSCRSSSACRARAWRGSSPADRLRSARSCSARQPHPLRPLRVAPVRRPAAPATSARRCGTRSRQGQLTGDGRRPKLDLAGLSSRSTTKIMRSSPGSGSPSAHARSRRAGATRPDRRVCRGRRPSCGRCCYGWPPARASTASTLQSAWRNCGTMSSDPEQAARSSRPARR